MSFLNRLTRKLQSFDTQDIQRAVWVAFIALVASLTLFGGYYYWDRYVHLGDKSPLELDIEQMEEKIRQDPRDPEVRVMLAGYYVNKRLYHEALDQTNQVLDLYPEHEDALLISGVAYAHLGQPEAALDPLERFVALRKDLPMAHTDTALETAYYFLGESYLNVERPDDAIRVLEAALTIKTTDADALYQLGLAYQASGQPEMALKHFHKAVRLVPDFVESYSGMVESYSALEQPDHVAYARGMQALWRQEYGVARTQLESATQAQPDFAPAFLGLGLTYEKMGQPQIALTALQRALELNPGDYAAQHAYGRVQAILDSED